MIISDAPQGTDGWWQDKLGTPSASNFDNILTPARLDYSTSATTYRNKLLAEQIRRKPDDGFQSDWMKRGHEVESEARDWYGFKYDCNPQQVGFCLHDSKRYGCSPDALINNGASTYEDGGLEIKCPSPGVHVGYQLANKLPTKYRLQVIGALLVTGRDWWDFISYHPDMDKFVVRTYAKDVQEDLTILKKALIRFCDDLAKQSDSLTNRKEAA